jgi:hypothetical protein
VWSLADGTCLRTLEGHTSSVLALSFVSAGTQLLSTGSDGLLKLWSVKTSECLNTFDEHEDKVWALAAADDGATVYTGASEESSLDQSGPLRPLAPFVCGFGAVFERQLTLDAAGRVLCEKAVPTGGSTCGQTQRQR